MKSFSEFTFVQQLGIMLGTAAVIVVVGEFLYFPPTDSLKTRREANQELEEKVKKQEAANAQLRPWETKLKDLKAENEHLELQLANLRSIVPEEKEADAFIRMVQGAAVQSGVNLRRFTARSENRQELYIEVPFDLTLDGTYFTVLDFFNRLSGQGPGGLGRIVNTGNLRIRPVGAGGGGKYTITANETVAGTCTATTFYSPQSQPAASQ